MDTCSDTIPNSFLYYSQSFRQQLLHNFFQLVDAGKAIDKDSSTYLSHYRSLAQIQRPLHLQFGGPQCGVFSSFPFPSTILSVLCIFVKIGVKVLDNGNSSAIVLSAIIFPFLAFPQQLNLCHFMGIGTVDGRYNREGTRGKNTKTNGGLPAGIQKR